LDNVQNNMKTKDKIISKALEMFNESGIEYVGMRELAAALNIRVGNITYYFPTKDDLVYELSMALNQLNAKILSEKTDHSIETFVLMFRQVFNNHYKFRCLLLSFVHLMKQNKRMFQTYQTTQDNRFIIIRSNINTLIRDGYLNELNQHEIAFLVSSITLIVRFWLSEAAISFNHLSPQEQIDHYVTMICRQLLPFATAKGKKKLKQLIKALNAD
jgi:AcrR family transcriptional regulator